MVKLQRNSAPLFMFRRKKKVQPLLDEYISRRYDDIAVCIHADLLSERGLQNHYTPWLEGMLQGFPEAQRKKRSLMKSAASRPALDGEAGPSTAGNRLDHHERDELNTVRGFWPIQQTEVERGGTRDTVGIREGEREQDETALQPFRHRSDRTNEINTMNSKFCTIL